jgi:hypothetical protein
MKVSYIVSEWGSFSTAYLEDEKLPDESYVGIDKYINLPVHLRWDDETNTWVEVCVRKFKLVDIYNERYEELLPRPECTCWSKK